jgi:hypothetical protein
LSRGTVRGHRPALRAHHSTLPPHPARQQPGAGASCGRERREDVVIEHIPARRFSVPASFHHASCPSHVSAALMHCVLPGTTLCFPVAFFSSPRCEPLLTATVPMLPPRCPLRPERLVSLSYTSARPAAAGGTQMASDGVDGMANPVFDTDKDEEGDGAGGDKEDLGQGEIADQLEQPYEVRCVAH